MTTLHSHMEIIVEISAAEFKAKCLKLMDQVARTRETVIITKRGKPVAKLVPTDEIKPRRRLFGCMAGSVTFEGDIVSPIDAEWAALSGEEDHLYSDTAPAATASRTKKSARKTGPKTKRERE